MGMEGLRAEDRPRTKQIEQPDDVDGVLAGALESLEQRIRRLL